MRIRPLLAVVLALCLAFFTTACSGDSDAVQRGGSNVTYDDIHNTGKANDCPTIGDSARGSIPLTAGGSYELREICSSYFAPASRLIEPRAESGRVGQSLARPVL